MNIMNIFGDITKEIYGPRIVEQLKQETFLAGQLPKNPPYKQERECTIEDVYIYSSDYNGMFMACDNCRTDKITGTALTLAEITENFTKYSHKSPQ